MTVFKRGKSWCVQVYEPQTKRPRHIGTFPTRKEAKAAEQDATRKRATGGRETVKDFAARWPRDYPRPRQSTNLHNTERIRKFVSEHGNRRLDSITTSEARQWALKHPSDLSAIRAMFNDARRDDLILINPFLGLGIKQSRGRKDLPADWLTEQDIQKLEDAARLVHGSYGPVMAAMIRFASLTGVRPGELWALRFEDMVGDTLVVRRAMDSKTRTEQLPKNGKPRTIVLPARAREAVESMPRFQGQERIFVGPRGGQLWGGAFSALWQPVRNAAGRPDLTLHHMRHFCATRLLELGLSASDVAVQLGHTDNGALVLSTYGHPSEIAARARILQAVDGFESGEVAAMRERKAAG